MSSSVEDDIARNLIKIGSVPWKSFEVRQIDRGILGRIKNCSISLSRLCFGGQNVIVLGTLVRWII